MLCILAFLVLCLFLLSIFKFNISIVGSRDELRSVKESKEYGVFVSEYYSPEGYILYPDNQRLYIKESWIEHDWVYNNWSKPTIVGKGVYGLCLVFNEEMDDYFRFRMSFQWKRGKRGYAKENELTDKTWNQVSIWSKGYTNDDTLNVYVAKYYYETQTYDTLTSFILVKKK